MTVMITLNQIKTARPCGEGWSAILKLRGQNADHDEPFPLVDALQSNPTSHVVWALQCLPNGKELAIRYALGCAEMVRHLMSDVRSTAALDAVALYLTDGTPVDADAAAAAYAADAAAAAYAAYAAARAAMLLILLLMLLILLLMLMLLLLLLLLLLLMLLVLLLLMLLMLLMLLLLMLLVLTSPASKPLSSSLSCNGTLTMSTINRQTIEAITGKLSYRCTKLHNGNVVSDADGWKPSVEGMLASKLGEVV